MKKKGLHVLLLILGIFSAIASLSSGLYSIISYEVIEIVFFVTDIAFLAIAGVFAYVLAKDKTPIKMIIAAITAIVVMMVSLSSFLYLLNINIFEGIDLYSNSWQILKITALTIVIILLKERNKRINNGVVLSYGLILFMYIINNFVISVIEYEQYETVFFITGVVTMIFWVVYIAMCIKELITGNNVDESINYENNYDGFTNDEFSKESIGVNQKMDVEFCRRCGNRVEDGQAVCLSCGFEPLNGFSYCNKCGVQTEEGQVLCVKCGFSLLNKKSKVSNSSGAKFGKLTSIPNVGFGVLGFFVPIAGLVLYLVMLDSEPDKAISAAKGAIISVITSFVLGLLYFLLMIAMII